MESIPKMNGKNWLAKGLVQALVILALGAYIAIDKLSSGNDYTSERIVRLEECMKRLDTMPEDMATVKVQIRNMEQTLAKIERKLDKN